MISPQAVLRDLKLNHVEFDRLPGELVAEGASMIARHLGRNAALEAIPSLLESYRPQDSAEENYQLVRQFALQDYCDEDSVDFRREWFHAETIELGIMLGYTRLFGKVSPDALLEDLAEAYWQTVKKEFVAHERHLEAKASEPSF